MSARPATTCVQCKTAPAIAFVFYAEQGPSAPGFPLCEGCLSKGLPRLLWWGFPVNLVPADKPASLEICHYGECARLCHSGRRACDTHLVELREVYAGKESGAGVAPPEAAWVQREPMNACTTGEGLRKMTCGGPCQFDTMHRAYVGSDEWQCTQCGIRRVTPGKPCEAGEVPAWATDARAALQEELANVFDMLADSARERTRGGYDR